MPQINHVFIDYENLQPQNIPSLNHPDVRLVILVGAQQKKVPIELAASLQPLGSRAQYIEIDASAPNALDFHIAYLVGRTTAADAEAAVHIISRDKGYDPLVRYLRRSGVRAFRVDSVKFLMRVDTVKSLDLAARALLACDMLDQFSGKPKTSERLQQTLKTLFHGALNDDEIGLVIDRLEQTGYFAVIAGEIKYLPHAPKHGQVSASIQGSK